jgi:hypothetical protein
VEVVQEIQHHVSRRGDEVVVPRLAVAVDRHGASATGQEGCGQADVLHVLEGRARNIAAILLVTVIVGAVVQHGDAIADQLHMAKLLRRDGGDQAVEGPQLALAAEVEALEHVVPEGGHFSILAAQEFLEGCGSVRVLPLGRRQIDLQLIDAQEHSGSPV